ncbi:hypothetical protein [Kibdelosporangium aridum]|uniref:Secreted protein n=1 Tax=Kibdelosporangium aridum TaxID=2030 RepID=A0A1Y5X3F5_KIBAR|nr:hypothetical protein [Kibdelosporangium aridum]SMC68871.1 hypothetical protein SAMN05661093_01445 [Kibdelosporangium aridum]
MSLARPTCTTSGRSWLTPVAALICMVLARSGGNTAADAGFCQADRRAPGIPSAWICPAISGPEAQRMNSHA